MKFEIAVAMTAQRGIGLLGHLPWPKNQADMKHFQALTRGSTVIMGRKTWDSLPCRPLIDRTNIVLTRDPEKAFAGALRASNLPHSLALAETIGKRTFVIGGEHVFREALADPRCARLFVTNVLTPFPCDTFFPQCDEDYFLEATSDAMLDAKLSFSTFARRLRTPADPLSREEHQYLNLVREIISSGNRKPDRTGTGTWSLFGKQMRFNLRHQFPLLTTKRVVWKSVVHELLWMIRGQTDARILAAEGVHIWDANGSREAQARLGLSREEGDLGPIYGHQWRYFGAPYVDSKTDYTNQGVDQLRQLVHLIKTEPDSRRLVLCSWNPCDLPAMALPPCHVLCQFYVAHGELSCHMYQRSADMGLGVPFNIAQYALLTCMISQVCGLSPGELVYSIGDAHVYSNHVAALQLQLERSPRAFPTLRLDPRVTDLFQFKADQVKFETYEPHASVNKMQMAV